MPNDDPLTLGVETRIPDGTAITAVVSEDIDATGDVDNTEELSLADGWRLYALDSFVGGSGNDYHVEIAAETSDPELSPRIVGDGIRLDPQAAIELDTAGVASGTGTLTPERHRHATSTGQASATSTASATPARIGSLAGHATTQAQLTPHRGRYSEVEGQATSRFYANSEGEIKRGELSGHASGTSETTPTRVAGGVGAGQAIGDGHIQATRDRNGLVTASASGTGDHLPHRGRYPTAHALATSEATLSPTPYRNGAVGGLASSLGTVDGDRIAGGVATQTATGISTLDPGRIAGGVLSHTVVGEATITPTRVIPGITSGEAASAMAAMPHRGRYSPVEHAGATASAAMPHRGRYSPINAVGSGVGTDAAGVIQGGVLINRGIGAGAITLTIIVPEPDTRHWGAGVSPAGVTPFGIGRRPNTNFQPTAYTIVLDNPARRDDPQDLGVSRTVLTDQTFSSLDATRRHTAMGDFTITVPGREDLHDLTGAQAFIYHRGDLIFRGRFEDYSHTRTSNLTTLRGMGVGITLEDGQAYTNYQNTPAVDALREYWDEYTQFDVEVFDPPVSQTFEDLLVSRIDGQSAMRSVLEPTITEPVTIEGGELSLQQSCFPIDGLDYTDRGNDERDQSDGTSIESSQFYAGGEAVWLTNVGDFVEYEFSPAYQIPQIRIRTRLGGQDKPEVTASLDGQAIGLAMTAMGNRFPQPEWGELRLFGETLRNIGGTRGETYTLRLEVTREDPVFSGGHAAVDMVAPFDLRYNYDWPVDVEDDGHLRGPQAFPHEYTVTPDEIETTSNITRAALDSTWNDTSGRQEIALSNDEGASFEPELNTETLDSTFGSFGYSITPRFTLSRYGERTGESPKEGFLSQTLSGWTIHADGNDLAIIGDEDYFGTHLENLQDLHEKAGLWFTLKHSPTTREAVSFPPNEPALQTEFPISERDWDDIESEQSDAGYYNRVVVQGRRRPDGSRRIVTRQNDDEIWARGGNPEDPDDPTGIKTFRHVDPRLATMDDVRAKAASLLAELSAGRTLSGSISAEPHLIDPGISYEVEPWGQSVPLDEVTYADGVGTNDGSYDFTEDDGLAGRLARLRADAKTIKDLL